MASPIDWETLRKALCALQMRILDHLLEARGNIGSPAMAMVADVTAADTIYAVDKLIEDRIVEWLATEWPARWPVQLMMEGLENHGDVTFPRGTPVADTVLKLMIDPIDGTREIMWDRRSGWALAGIAPQRGPENRIGDLQVAAMTELPTTRAWRADQLSAVRGGKLVAEAIDLFSRKQTAFQPQPFPGTDLHHGFSGLAAPFPGSKQTVGAILENLLARLEPGEAPNTLPIFDDQYLCTGGLFADLATGKLRFYGDLRPEVFAHLNTPATLCAHPYDVCTALIVEAAGGIIRGLHGPLDGPLDTTSAITWIGYANAELAARIHPALEQSVQAVLVQQ